MEAKLRWTITLTAAIVLAVAFALGLGLSAAVAGESKAPAGEPGTATVQAPQRTAGEVIGLAASVAFTTSLACVSAAYAVGKVGAAALGAAAERPEILGRSLLFVGLAEGIAIYGLIIAILLLRMIG
ncbi:MAG: H+transporting two-sector ATPase C subunit [Candidatus Brocadiae bacterium]|nr:H+transporting two-sector ATPase C subunit [Candidatus Brocadiia bacterium]